MSKREKKVIEPTTREVTAKRQAGVDRAFLAALTPIPLHEERFYSDVVPTFEKARDQISKIVAKDKRLASKLASMRLVILDNRKSEKLMVFWLTDTYEKSCYLYDQHQGMRGISGYSSSEINMRICDRASILDGLRSVFLKELLSRAKAEDLASYLKTFLRSNYTEVEELHTNTYYLLRIVNLDFGVKGWFAVLASHRNLVIPMVAELNAADIPGGSGDNKKIVFTTREDVSGYRGFDAVLDYWEVFFHFSLFMFTYAVPLYQKLARLPASELYEAVAFLRTTGSTEIFDLKRELATVPLSNGKQFERCIEKVLDTCMRPSYDVFHLAKQVPNRNKITIRDFIITNNGSTHAFLQRLETRGVELLLFDAKNYEKPLTPTAIARFRTYLTDNRAFGDFGVILSKRGISKNCSESLFRASLASQNQLILVLDESDIFAMLDKVEDGGEAADIIRDKYYKLMMEA